MKKPLSATIKFSGKKAITKKEFKKFKIIETWELSETSDSKEFFIYNGGKYYLINSIQK